MLLASFIESNILFLITDEVIMSDTRDASSDNRLTEAPIKLTASVISSL